MSRFDFKSHELVRCHTIAGLRVAVTSDNHVMPNKASVFTDWLINGIRPMQPDMIALLGDHLENAKGETLQRKVGRIVRRVAEVFPDTTVVFIPGNHCLRGNGIWAWTNFGPLPENIKSPIGKNSPMQPLRFDVKGVSVVAANVLYDKSFVDFQELGISAAAARAFYRETNDGRYLFHGRRDMFQEMADNAAKEIRRQHTDIFMSHALPDRALCDFRVAAETSLHQRMEQGRYNFIVDPQGDAAIAQRLGMTVEDMRNWWLLKGATAMGSDVLARNGMPVPEGLSIIHGHNHRSRDGEEIVIGGRAVKVFSYQPDLSGPK